MNSTAIKFFGIVSFLILGIICSADKLSEIREDLSARVQRVFDEFPGDSFYLVLDGRSGIVRGIVKDSAHLEQMNMELRKVEGLILKEADIRVLPPPEPEAVQENLDSLIAGKRVEFLPNSSELDSESFALLRQVANLLKKYPDAKLEIAGHTDDQGDAAYNLRLSQQRAERIRDFLEQTGIHPERLRAKGYGETQPLVPGRSREARTKNRRVEFNVLEQSK